MFQTNKNCSCDYDCIYIFDLQIWSVSLFYDNNKLIIKVDNIVPVAAMTRLAYIFIINVQVYE